MTTFPMPGPEPGEHRVFPHTEKGNADRLIHRYGRAIRYCPTTRSWYIFDSKRWVKDDLMVIRELQRRQRVPFGTTTMLKIRESGRNIRRDFWAFKLQSSLPSPILRLLGPSTPSTPTRFF